MEPTYFIPCSGRPNAGKTSLINYLAQTKHPVGKYPGTTLKITPIPLIWDVALVDLPGYGKALKRSKKIEDRLKDAIVQYMDDPKKNFLIGIHTIDVSTFSTVVHNLEKKNIIPIDIEMVQFVAEITEHPPFVAFNKIDKVSQKIIDENLALFKSYSLPEVEIFLLSIRKNEGCRILRNRLKEVIVQKLGSKYQKW